MLRQQLLKCVLSNTWTVAIVISIDGVLLAYSLVFAGPVDPIDSDCHDCSRRSASVNP